MAPDGVSKRGRDLPDYFLNFIYYHIHIIYQCRPRKNGSSPESRGRRQPRGGGGQPGARDGFPLDFPARFSQNHSL
jgi:hypothetical protein